MHLDSLIFILFLLINLFIGIRTTNHASIQSTHFTTPHIIGAILAITYGGEVLYKPLHIRSLLGLGATTISYFIISRLLAHRLHIFLNNGSVAAIMGQLYGHPIRKIVAICGILHSASVAAIQCKLLSMAICWFFAMPTHYSLLIAALCIMCSIGANAIQSLAWLRVMRCATFGILLPIIAWTLWKATVNQYNLDQAHLALAIKRSWHNLTGGHAAPMGYMVYLTAFAMPAFYPAQVASIVGAQNTTQIQRSFNGAGFFSLSINLLLLWVALLVQTNPGKLMLAAMPLATFCPYLGLKGLFMIGMAALTTSTAGANLHAAIHSMTNDLPDFFKWLKRPILYQSIVGIMAASLGLYAKDQTVWIAMILFKTVVSPPLLCSLVGISLYPYAVLIGMLAGGITTIACFCFVPSLGMHGLLPAILLNLLSMLVTQLCKGSQRSDQPHVTNSLTQDPAPKPPPLWKWLCKYILQRIKQFNLWNHLQKQLPKDNLPYALFGFYILLTGYGSFYTFSSNPIWYARLEALMLLPSLFVATFFLAYTLLTPQSYIRKCTSVIWPLSHVYFLFIVGTSMVMLSKFTHLYNIIFILNILLAIFITPLVVIWFGCIMSIIMVWIVRHYMDNHSTLIDCCLDLNINVAYAILMLFVIITGFLYHNKDVRNLVSMVKALTSEQEEQNARQFFNKQQIEALAYESSYIISQLNNQLTQLKQSEGAPLPYSEQAIRLKNYFNSIFQHLKHNLHLVTNWISIDQLLAESFDAIKISTIYDVPYVMIHTKHLYIQCAIEKIKALIISSLYSCNRDERLHNAQRKDVYIYIDDTQLGYRLTLLQGRVQKINAISFVITTATKPPTIRPVYKVAEMADIQIIGENETKIDSENQHIVHAHYGYYERLGSELEATHLYVIPVNVKEITKAFATLSPVVYTQKMVLDPVSIQEEAAFLKKAKQKKGLNIDAIMDALQLIKVYYTTQRRKTGELFYLHPVSVASILLTITDNSNVIIAGLVHDVVQNTPLTEAGLTTLFGAAITQTIAAAAHLEKALPIQTSDYANYIETLISGTNHDAILIRLADVLHNARTISGHAVQKQIAKARLIQKLYLPLAMQLQLVDIAHELALHSAKILKTAMMRD